MTMQEKVKEILNKLKDDNVYSFYNQIDVERIMIGENVLENEDIDDFGSSMYLTANECFYEMTASTVGFIYSIYNSLRPTTLLVGSPRFKMIGGIYVPKTASNIPAGNPTVWLFAVPVNEQTVTNRTDLVCRGAVQRNSDKAFFSDGASGGYWPNSYSSRSARTSNGDIWASMGIIVPIAERLYWNIDKLQIPLVVYNHLGQQGLNNGLTADEIRDILTNYDSISELKANNSELFEKFKSWCFNYNETEDDPTTKEELKSYYIQNQTYKTDSRKSYKERYESEKNLEFLPSLNAKIYGYITDNFPFNIVLKCKDSPLRSLKQINNNTREVDVISVSQFNEYYATEQFTYKTLISDGGATFYYGQLRTNIPIFKDKNLADKYENGDIGIEQALQKGNTDIVNPIGEQLTDATNNEHIYNTSGYEIYTLSFSELKNVFKTLHDETATDWEQVLDGLKFYGSNPIDSVLNLYHLPFNPSLFGSFASQQHATFGAYTLNLDFSINSLINTGKLFALFNEPITPMFNDFRDYTNIKYTLYLPYFGFIDLRTDEIMETSLSCKCAFDFATHNLKYYIYADNKLINQVETSVGNNVPITVNDNVAKQEQILQGITQVVGGGLSMASAVASGVGGSYGGLMAQIDANDVSTMGALNTVSNGVGAMGGSLGGVLGGANSMLQGTKAIYDNAPRQIKGNVSNAVAHNDIPYPFLIVEVCPSVAPLNEIEMFGKPTNAIATLNNFHGFTIVNDIRLHSIANKRHKDMIKALLSSGVILP